MSQKRLVGVSSTLIAASILLAACGQPQVVEKIVEKPVEVVKEVRDPARGLTGVVDEGLDGSGGDRGHGLRGVDAEAVLDWLVGEVQYDRGQPPVLVHEGGGLETATRADRAEPPCAGADELGEVPKVVVRGRVDQLPGVPHRMDRREAQGSPEPGQEQHPRKHRGRQP